MKERPKSRRSKASWEREKEERLAVKGEVKMDEISEGAVSLKTVSGQELEIQIQSKKTDSGGTSHPVSVCKQGRS